MQSEYGQLSRMEFDYVYSEGTKNPSDFISGKTSDPDEVKVFLDKLTDPKRSMMIGYNSNFDSVDFLALGNGKIEIEIMPYHAIEDFATVDISMAKAVADLFFQSSDSNLFRQMLHELPIKWEC
jgi:hypothetical protein